MFVPVFTIKFLAILSFLFAIVSGNPIKRSEEEATGVRISGLFGLFTTLATSALTTGEQVGIVILSSQTIFIQEPNFFPATEWGVPEPTRSSTSSSTSTLAAGAVAVTSTFGNTPYSFPTPGFPAASTQVDASASEDSSTDAQASTSASDASVTDTPAPASASASEDSIPPLILTPLIGDKQQIAATTTSCNPAIAGVTIPASALTTGEFVAVEVLCEETIYIQEPNFYPTKTFYGIPASWTLNTTDITSTSTSTMCNTAVAGTTIPVSALTTGELVAVETLCGETVYIQEPNFYPTKTYYGVSASTSTMSASSTSTIVDVEPQVMEKRAGDSVPFFANNMPTSLRHVNANRIQSIECGAAGASE
ncbi:uncharacterized protein EAF01_004106 [Botrytis porri]|uniref:Ubiquitin 3 binding protein But2 C-terminal domain-containing protein n=1 Tax=Botrytis porri TaxID=87229 RepID=A0A4Z1KP87_9HELO|nr:uncharacterized protein EAF01_004106 [Botrytis porri]KAF7908351.1 hypothetical protein EAF01_004106 [Botrytis porri]TGO87873.1 hypothetical protein BPOR_0198g00090 [Botrytis porri]